MANKRQVDLGKVENSGTAFFKKHLLFLKKKSKVFEIKNRKVLAKKNHTFLSDRRKILEKWQAVNTLT